MKQESKYIPERGDIVWLNFNPQQGKEQAGHRPALVLSSSVYNKKGLCLVCPITSKSKGYPFEIPIKIEKIKGSILADHIKNQDWRERNARFVCRVDQSTLNQVLAFVSLILTK